jgi:nuclear pore complex protein Nup107
VGELEGDAEEEEDVWRADVEQELQTLAAVQVQEGLGADNPFHISQLHIILDHTDALLDDFASRLRDGAYDPESSEYVLPLPFRYDLVISLSIILGIRR